MPGYPAEDRAGVAPPPGDVHLWSARLDLDADRLALLSRALSGDEHERARRFRFERDRIRWTAARGWLRRLLAGYLDAEAAELRFERHAFGKPRLAAPWQSLRFNLSHSADLVAFAVAHDREVGLDVERIRDDLAVAPLAVRFFSEREQAALARLTQQARVRETFQVWTAKEAYLKASGVGLRASTADLDVVWLTDEKIGVSGSWSGAQVGRWSLQAFDAGPHHMGTVAVEGHGARIPVVAEPLGLHAHPRRRSFPAGR